MWAEKVMETTAWKIKRERRRVSWTRKTIESPASFILPFILWWMGEPFNSSPAIPAAIDKRIIQDSRLFLFSILLFSITTTSRSWLNSRWMDVGGKIDQVLNSLQQSAPHKAEDDGVGCNIHVFLYRRNGGREKGDYMHLQQFMAAMYAIFLKNFIWKKEKTFFNSISTFWTRSMFRFSYSCCWLTQDKVLWIILWLFPSRQDGHYRRRRNKVATGIKLYATAVIYAHGRRRRRTAINSSAQDNACGRSLCSGQGQEKCAI